MQVELLSWKSIKDIAGDGGIIKTIETEGKGWEKPKDKDEALGECSYLSAHLQNLLHTEPPPETFQYLPAVQLMWIRMRASPLDKTSCRLCTSRLLFD